jgi:TPR repeat protein
MLIFLATQSGTSLAKRRAQIAWRTFTFLFAFAIASFASFAAPAPYQNLLKKAHTGDIRAQVQVGIALLNGDGTLSDPAAAAEWFRRAANAGDPQAQTLLLPRQPRRRSARSYPPLRRRHPRAR